MVEMACFKAKKRKSFYSEKHSKIFSAILRYEELYLDELAELLELPQKEINEILSDLISRKLIRKNDFKYRLIEPFESTNSFLFGKK
ncbi:MAG: helix-turn-helix domain-containing protein [archaeon]